MKKNPKRIMHSDGVIMLRPKVLADRKKFMTQLRKDIEASKADVAAGRYLGPFDNAADAERALGQFKSLTEHPK